jgi:NhaP-type Na+/H+ or K+/H+ antiporter
VVSALRSVGAPKMISTLIEAESLLNDGSGLVLFLVSVEWAAGRFESISSTAANIVWLTVGGPLIGKPRFIHTGLK